MLSLNNHISVVTTLPQAAANKPNRQYLLRFFAVIYCNSSIVGLDFPQISSCNDVQIKNVIFHQNFKYLGAAGSISTGNCTLTIARRIFVKYTK